MATSKGERVFAVMGVIIVVASAAALSGAVIIQQIMSNQATASQNQQSSLACVDNNTEQKFPLPTAYTTTEPVTALQQTDLTVGSGQAAKGGDCLIVKYYGSLATTGEKFDENFSGTTGFAFRLGQGQVIKGWDQGLMGMKQGGERRLVIPAALGYGDQSAGSIPPNATLVFDVRLLRIQ